MGSVTIALILLVILCMLILLGVHIVFALGIMSFIGVWWITGNLNIAFSLLTNTSLEAVRDYVFAVIPLFILMGSFMTNSNAVEDIFYSLNYFLRKILSGMAIATIIANAIFAAVTGVSIASAAVFSKLSIPQMSKLGYTKKFSAGVVAGGSVLGMLIPPSLLMIVYGMLSQIAIGKMFIAGIIPGLIMTLIYSLGIIFMSIYNPKMVGKSNTTFNDQNILREKLCFFSLFVKPLPIVMLVVVVLGGIWFGFFTPTEASAFGAMGAGIIAYTKGMRKESFKNSLYETASTTASVMLLLIMAQMYSRMLTVSGLTSWLTMTITNLNVHFYIILFLYCLLLLLMGCILDSTSILLIAVPLMLPVAKQFGFNLIWFGVITVIAVEMGLLTPPFGMVVFTIKSALGDSITLEEIFRGSFPFLIMIILTLLIIICFPSLSTWLPSLM